VSLTEGLAPLSARQRAIYWIVVVICGATRFLAMARSLWDWDEALFCLGMRSYDVTNHHPHPPGFPVYIAAAKLLRIFMGSDFRALQAINLIAGVLLFPAMFMLARELRLRFPTSVIAGALCVFFPNVWFFGGTAFSDVASITLVIFAVAFLFRGCRDANAYFIGAFLLALSAGIRPQNLLIGLFPAALATWHRSRQSLRDVGFAALIGTAMIGVSYAAAIRATGNVDQYMTAVRAHGEYITRVDSFRSPDRPPLWRLIDRFFIRQYQSPALSLITSAFVLLSIAGAIRRGDRSMLYNALTFAPFAISAWLMLDRYSVSRFSIGYAPMFAIFAADGIARVTRRAEIESVVGAALIAAFFIWTWPALAPVRNETAPSVLAVGAVRQHVDYRRDDLFVAFPMIPFIDYFQPDFPYHVVFDERAMPMSAGPRRPYLLAETERTEPRGYVFRRERGRLWNITRRHYFEVALEPLQQLPRFASGWYPPERAGTDEWRWMSGRSLTVLPPSSGTTKLRIQFDVPDELMPVRPTVTITLNGALIDSVQPAEAHLAREYDVAAVSGPNTLEIATSRTLNAARERIGTDPRELGLLVRYLSWGPEQ
jgi:hypothetical protein